MIVLSLSLERDILEKAEIALKDGKFRNRSHLVEMALQRMMEEDAE
jgi:metal-responsive CopG/Arc/MetJ family transcriptional regulator